MSRARAGRGRSWSICRRTSCSHSGTYRGPETIKHKSYRPQVEPDPARIEEAVDADRRGQAAAVLWRRRHHQFRAERACQLFAELVHMTGFPSTLTLMGLGAFPASDRQFLGMVGMHGTYEVQHGDA